MTESSDLLCFHCGQSISEPPQIHELPGGGSCPGCVERVLAALPPVLPTELEQAEPYLETAQEEDLEEVSEPHSSLPHLGSGSDLPPEPA